MARQVVRFRACDFCGSDKGVITNKVMVNGDSFDIDLCGQHSSDMEDDFFAWTSCGTKTGESIFYRARPAAQLVTEVTRSRPEVLPPPPPPPPTQLDAVPESAQRWQVTKHAAKKMQERGFRLADVLRAAEDPESTEPDTNKAHLRHIRGGCVVTVNPLTQEVLTVDYSDKHPMSDTYEKVRA